MKWFYCEYCDKKYSGLNVLLKIEAYVYLHNGEMRSEWEGDLPLDNLSPDDFACPECGGEIRIAEAPCDHDWGGVQLGYGDAKGKVLRRCRICNERQIGKVVPVWDE